MDGIGSLLFQSKKGTVYLLRQGGWKVSVMMRKGEATYSIKAKPGIQIKIAAGKFSVVCGPAVLQESLDMVCLPGSLRSLGRKINYNQDEQISPKHHEALQCY